MKDIHPKAWIVLLALALLLAAAGWHFRHAVQREVLKLNLAKVDAPARGAIRFAAIGDYGNGSRSAWDVALMIESWNPHFITTVGDNNYGDGKLPRGAEETIDQNVGRLYNSYISPYKGKYGSGAVTNRFYPIPGHSDWDSADGLKPYLDYFTLPGNERYYDFVRGPVHFFMLDTDEREPDGASATSIQGRWLKRKLSESNAPWKLVYASHAPYTSHAVPDVEYMRWPFKAWGADAVLSGYYHVYERLLVDGIPYFVNGTGGTWVSGFGEIDDRSEFRYREEFGAMLIDATDTRIKFRFVNRLGRIVDEYVLTKNQASERPSVLSQ